MRLAVALVAGLMLAPIGAAALTLEGEKIQGGLLRGVTSPGAVVTLDDIDVPVARDGTFYLGFGRDAKAHWTLRIEEPGGAAAAIAVEIDPRTYDIQRIDGLPQRQVTPRQADLDRIKANNRKIGTARGLRTVKRAFGLAFGWPVNGVISGVYGSQRVLNGKPRRPHNGVDIAAAAGTPIVAPADGTVALVHPDMFYTGKTMMIDHGLGVTTVYAHMDRIDVTEGTVVRRGDPIGTVGATGRVTGAHLHWGLTWQWTHLDPAQLTGPMPGTD